MSNITSRGGWRAAMLLATAGLVSLSALGFAPERPAPLAELQPATEPAAATPGWLARYVPGKGANVKRIATHAPYAALAVDPGQSLHPAIPAADFEVTFDAEVRLADAGKYRFGAEVEGGSGQLRVLGEKMTAPVTLRLTVGGDGARYTDWIDLPAGTATVQVTFKRAGDAKARLRTMWEKQGFGKAGFRAEPIPPTSVRVPAAAKELVAAAASADHGRVLLGELGCVHCHSMEAAHAHAHNHGAANSIDFSSPVIHAMGPSLQDIGTRVNPFWITKWIADPQGERPGSGMPGVLRGKDMGEDATNITHFLYSLSPNFKKEAAATEPEGLNMGKKLFQTLGCVACHGEKPGEKNAPQPLIAAASKWNPTELSKYLMDPRKARPSGRMPVMNLNQQEADLLATYLISAFGESNAPKQEFKVDAARVDSGKAAFAARGCASCHAVTDAGGKMVASGVTAKSLFALGEGGCIDPKGTPKAPRYVLSETDRNSIKAALKELKAWTGDKGLAALTAAPLDRTHQMFDQFNCRECHEVHGEGGVRAEVDKFFTTIGEADLGEEGRIPPRLIGPGTKLNTAWLHQVLENAGRARPYMGARMPQFGTEHVGFIADELSKMEGVWPNTDATEPVSNDDMVQAGRLLTGVNGLNCISCHVVGDNAPAGMPGPDITMFAARVRYEWWMDYVHAPSRYKPGTRMPSFYENGIGAVTSVFGGDSVKQSDAMWAYFNLGEFMPAPDGITKPEGYVIKVGSRPVVMRTFLRDGGSRGIAVGFPDSLGAIHFAFDAEKVRLVDAWQGTFLNASGAWAGRGGNVTGGQGSGLWSAPNGPAIVIGEKAPTTWPTLSGRDAGYRFKGYRLDDKGFPTFEYDVKVSEQATAHVMERFEPTADKKIKRTFEIKGLPKGASVWLRNGKGLETNTALANVDAVKITGKDDDTVLEVKPKGDGTMSFAVVVKP